jgi:hypothetical protein
MSLIAIIPALWLMRVKRIPRGPEPEHEPEQTLAEFVA